FEDGGSITVPVVWISTPIDAGFFVYEVPRARWAVGSRPDLLILRGADGHELSRDSSAFRTPVFRGGPSTGLAQCLFRRADDACFEPPIGSGRPPMLQLRKR